MARNRVIYQSEGLFVSSGIDSTGAGQHSQLRRVQSANYSFEIARQDVNQFGQLARIDALVLQSPTVSIDLSYYLADGYNENKLGFYVQQGATQGNMASGQMVSSSGRNLYIVTDSEGSDLNGDNSLSGKGIIGIGNAFITDYTLDAAVGDFPTVSVSAEALGFCADTYALEEDVKTGFATPAINPANGTRFYPSGESQYFVQLPNPVSGDGPTALRPGDITVDFGNFADAQLSGAVPTVDLTGDGAINIQSVSLSLPMSRTPIERLGSRFAFARVTDFPITATMTVNALVSESVANNLADMVDDSKERTITLTIKKPGTNSTACIYSFKGARLDSQSFSSDIGSNKSVDLTFSTQIGGPSDTLHGVYMSGSYT